MADSGAEEAPAHSAALKRIWADFVDYVEDKLGPPPKSSESGGGGKRRNGGMALGAGIKGYGACDDEKRDNPRASTRCLKETHL